MKLSTPSAAITQRLERSSLTPAPMWPSVNSAANPSAIVTAVTAMSGGCEKNRFGPPAPAIARPRKPAKLTDRECGEPRLRHGSIIREKGRLRRCDATVKLPAAYQIRDRSRQDSSLQIAADQTNRCSAPRPPDGGAAGKDQSMRSDIEIARAARLKPIAEIAAKIGAPESAWRPYGRSIAKLEYDFLRSLADRPDGKLILVSAINPTPAGEGKTTTTIGLGDALNRIGRKTDHLSARAFAWALLRHEGRRNGRRVRPSRADGRDQPSFHRRLSRNNLGAQSPRGNDRQSHVLGQCARLRSAPRRLAARHRHERPLAARDGHWARRRKWISARGRISTSRSPRK